MLESIQNKVSLQSILLLTSVLAIANLSGLVSASSIPSMSVQQTNEGIKLTTAELAIEFAPEGSGMGVLSIKHLRNNTEFIKKAASNDHAKIWRIALTDDVTKHDEFVNLHNTDKCREQTAEFKDNTLTLSWNGFDIGSQENVIDVVLEIKLWSNTQMTDWRITVENRSTSHGIWHIYGPILELGVIGDSGDDDYLILPAAEGRSINDPIYWDQNQKNERIIHDLTTDLEPVKMDNKQASTGFGIGAQEPYGMPYPTDRGQIQLNAYYQKKGNFYYPSKEKGPGLYLSAHDSFAYPKVFYATNYEIDDILNFTYGAFPADSAKPGLDYKQAFPYVIGVFNGDWHDAAAIYRKWATRQIWCRKGTLAKRKDVPDWIKNTTAWVRLDSRQTVPDAIHAVKFYRDKLAGDLCVQWYKWEDGIEDNRNSHICSYHPTHRIGTKGFGDAIKMFQEMDCHVFPYINTRLWGHNWGGDLPELIDFEVAREHIQRDATGELYQYAPGNHETGIFCRMCLFSDFWQEFMADTAEQIVKGYGVDGLYLDQAGGVSFGGGYYPMQGCFDKSHGHPLGVTKALCDVEHSRIRMLYNRSSVHNRELIIAGEGSAEPWIDILNTKIIHYEIWPGHVPLYGTVYHDYQTYFGRTASLQAKDPKDPMPQMQIGWELIMGEQLGRLWPDLVKTTVKKRNLKYVQKACSVKNKFPQYLNVGQMLRPPYISDVPDLTTDEFSRINNLCTLPAVLASAWKSTDGKVAIVVTNMSLEEIDFDLEFSPQDYGFDGEVSLVQKYPSEKPLNSEYDGTYNKTSISMDALDVMVIEVIFVIPAQAGIH